jgi:hypothetical protein
MPLVATKRGGASIRTKRAGGPGCEQSPLERTCTSTRIEGSCSGDDDVSFVIVHTNGNVPERFGAVTSNGMVTSERSLTSLGNVTRATVHVPESEGAPGRSEKSLRVHVRPLQLSNVTLTIACSPGCRSFGGATCVRNWAEGPPARHVVALTHALPLQSGPASRAPLPAGDAHDAIAIAANPRAP